MSNVCFGIAGRLFGHNYQPRITEGAPTFVAPDIRVTMMFSDDIVDAIAASKPTIYHGDVCTRCGHTVNAPRAAS